MDHEQTPVDMRKEKFAEHYFRFGHREKAVVYAGYDCKTLKEGSNSATVTANRLLRDSYVCRRLTQLLDKSLGRMLISKRRVLHEAARIAFFDPRKLFDPEGRLLNVNDLDDNTAANIAEVTTETLWEGGEEGRRAVGTTTKVKFWNKVTALDLLAKYYKLYEKDEKEAGDSYHYHFYIPDNQRTNEPIVVNGNGHDPQATLEIPDNGHGGDNGAMGEK